MSSTGEGVGSDSLPTRDAEKCDGSKRISSFSEYGNSSAAGKSGEAPALCQAILEDHAFIREDLPKAAILTLTGQFVTVVVMRTPYSRVQLRIQVRKCSSSNIGTRIGSTDCL